MDGNIDELWWNKGGWQPHHPISQIVNTKPASGTHIIGYATEYEKTHHVFYIDQNTTLQEVYHDSHGWHSTWISQSAGSGATPPIGANSPLAGYSDENLNEQHLFYIDSLTRVHEIYRKGNSWFAGMVAS